MHSITSQVTPDKLVNEYFYGRLSLADLQKAAKRTINPELQSLVNQIGVSVAKESEISRWTPREKKQFIEKNKAENDYKLLNFSNLNSNEIHRIASEIFTTKTMKGQPVDFDGIEEETRKFDGELDSASEEDLGHISVRQEIQLSNEEVSIRIQTLDVASFTQELGLIDQEKYRGDLGNDKLQILDLISYNNESILRQTSARGSDFWLFKRLFEGIEQAKQEIALNPLAWRGSDIIGKPQRIDVYVDEYFGQTRVHRKQKSAARALHFTKNGYSMRISRGDGNCFTNSLAAGLMDVVKKNPDYRGTLIEKLREFQSCQDPYVLLDTGLSAPPYSQSFRKNEDFIKLIKDLEQGKKDLGNHTMAAFSRVLRYVLTLDQFKNVYIEGTSQRVGKELGFANIFTFNKAFGLNARVLVLEAKPFIDEESVEHLNEQDPEDPSSIFRASGTQDGRGIDDPQTKMGMVRIADLLREEPGESFNIIRTDGHFNLMVKV